MNIKSNEGARSDLNCSREALARQAGSLSHFVEGTRFRGSSLFFSDLPTGPELGAIRPLESSYPCASADDSPFLSALASATADPQGRGPACPP